jgi:cardiolipin synthase
VRVFDVGAPEGEQVVHDRVLTVPNALTFARLLLLPIVYVDLVGGRSLRAMVLVALLGATDWFDGYLARRLDRITRLGKVLDPIGDRALLAVVGVGSVVAGILPLWVVVTLLLREVLVAAPGLVLLSWRGALPETSRLGKASTMGIMIALPLFLASAALLDGGRQGVAAVRGVAWAVLLPSLALAYAAAVGYARQVLPALRAGRPGGARSDDRGGARG